MKILVLAIKSGIDPGFFVCGELHNFARAISAQAIEEYKASLVPVAYMSTDENHMEWRKGALLELGFKDNEVKPLYALPKETK